MTYRLPVIQKWQLALGLIGVYYPVLLYIDFPVYSPNREFSLSILYYQFTVCLVLFLFYFIWAQACEQLLHQLSEKFGEAFLLEFRLPAQLVLMAMATGLAVAFIIVSREVLQGLDFVLRQVFQTHLLIPLPKRMDPAYWQLYRRVNIGSFIMLMLSGFYLIANRRATLRMKEMHLKAEQLEKETVKAQLAVLKNQVNPHFLFNSLGIISSLVHKDPDLTEKFIEQLSQVFRYILAQKESEKVSLKVELQFIQSYLFLLQIRFNDKLKVSITVPEKDGNQYLIAPLTLQLLVENAVQHNQMSVETPLHVQIRSDRDELVICNTLQPRIKRMVSTGMGLQNIINRYGLLTYRQVWVGELNGTFTVRIPLLS